MPGAPFIYYGDEIGMRYGNQALYLMVKGVFIRHLGLYGGTAGGSVNGSIKPLPGRGAMAFLLSGGPSHYDDLFRCAEPFFSHRGKGDVSKFAAHYQYYIEKAAARAFPAYSSHNSAQAG